MKAMVARAYGGPEVLKLEDVPAPEMKPGHVRIRVRACGVNFADTLMVQGRYQEKPPFPFAPGLEIAGEVIETAGDVDAPAPGTRVLAMSGNGGYAEEAVVPAGVCVPIPDAMTDVDAAAFAVAFGTSHVGLWHKARLQEGETLLVHGASGGVGLTAVEIGKIMGATVIATASSEDKLAIAASKGADHLLLSSDPDLKDRIKEIAAPTGGVNVAYDPVGGDMFDASLRTLAFEGRIVIIGFASGTIPQIPANILLVKNVDVLGLYWGSYARRKPAVLAESFGTLMDWYVAGRIRPHVSKVYPLAEAGEALTHMMSRKATGKLVVEIG
ncbi:MAG: NADPH:quinone oxidoreductase family protein [Alphaproteobacteria bacterium]|nr:NADPH:quinone oxidoreductase family protein [Alphaproteobacteria bacterium]MDX5369646.1 NADPH:quinone oxidoreductase family protein [Alphaproteobacteria bacterium]MDX5464281.1 NADPH:quinone oxidoreductase family protein [Alphaproteobacteria bacterium]